jgi:hypothetical protein
MESAFFIALNTVLAQDHIPEKPPALLRKWDSFVDSCLSGYAWDISEYNNEIRVRDHIEVLLQAECLQQFPEIQAFRELVNPIDQQFKAVLQPDKTLPKQDSWWRKGVLKYAGEPYARYMQRVYGIEVDIVEE